MLRGVLITLVVVSVLATASPASAADNESPLPAAGLDQTVEQGQVVYLDAGGSVDPDGEIVSFEWTITAPDGTTMEPRCGGCETTQFQALQSGTYEVQVTVTDDDGATSSDTMYVDSQAAEPASVSLYGPESVVTDETATFNASVTAGDAPLSRVAWYWNDTRDDTESLNGTTASPSVNETFQNTGQRTLTVVVTDEYGIETRVNHSVTIDQGSVQVNGPNKVSGFVPSTPDVGAYTSRIDRPIPQNDGVYRLRLEDGALKAGWEDFGTLLSEGEIKKLKEFPGVKKKWSSAGWTGVNEQLVITNSEIKNDIDKDVTNHGFRNANLQHLNPNDPEYAEVDENGSSNDDGTNSESTTGEQNIDQENDDTQDSGQSELPDNPLDLTDPGNLQFIGDANDGDDASKPRKNNMRDNQTDPTGNDENGSTVGIDIPDLLP